jgi:hypothetical protein
VSKKNIAVRRFVQEFAEGDELLPIIDQLWEADADYYPPGPDFQAHVFYISRRGLVWTGTGTAT